MKEKVLITGISGFVGYHLLEAALQSGLEVYGAVRPSSQLDHLKHFDFQAINLDFNDSAAIKSALEKKQFDYIIHAAGITKAKTQEEYNAVNAAYTLNLAKAASEANINLKKFVFISSLAAVGPAKNVISDIIDESRSFNPVTSYGKSKVLAEQYLSEFNGNLPLITLRPTAVYGPRERDIFIMFKTLTQGLEPYIGRTEQKYSFIYVKDLVDITIKSLYADITGKCYNVTDGLGYNRYALADLSKEILGRKTLKFHVPLGIVKIIAGLLEFTSSYSKKTPALNKEKLNELTAPSWYCSIENIKKDLGFEPKYDLKQGLTETLNWYKENKWI